MKKGNVAVAVERLAERYCGELTGSVVFHVTTAGLSDVIKHGCPLGRGTTREAALQDFCFRANEDDSALKLTVKRLVVCQERDLVGKPPSGQPSKPIYTGDM
jgi:hypothetical protein